MIGPVAAPAGLRPWFMVFRRDASPIESAFATHTMGEYNSPESKAIVRPSQTKPGNEPAPKLIAEESQTAVAPTDQLLIYPSVTQSKSWGPVP